MDAAVVVEVVVVVVVVMEAVGYNRKELPDDVQTIFIKFELMGGPCSP